MKFFAKKQTELFVLPGKEVFYHSKEWFWVSLPNLLLQFDSNNVNDHCQQSILKLSLSTMWYLIFPHIGVLANGLCYVLVPISSCEAVRHQHIFFFVTYCWWYPKLPMQVSGGAAIESAVTDLTAKRSVGLTKWSMRLQADFGLTWNKSIWGAITLN